MLPRPLDEVVCDAAVTQSDGVQSHGGALTRALRGQVMSKELAEHGYYKQKGEVEKLASKYVAQVCMLGSGDLLQARPALPACPCSRPCRRVSGAGQTCSTFACRCCCCHASAG